MFEVKANRNKNTKPYCAAVIHPIDGETIKKYKKLAADPATQAVWTTAFGKEWGNLTQGYNKTKTKGTDSTKKFSTYRPIEPSHMPTL